MKKRIILIFSLFLLTGCSVSYDITLSDELNVTEELYLIGKSTEFTSYGDDLKNTFDNIIKIYQENNIKPKLNLNTINYDHIDDKKEYLDITLKREYKSILKYQNSDILKYAFKSFDIVEEDNQYILYINGINWNNIDNATKFDKYDFNIDKINVKITIPYKIISSNSDYYEEDKNTYIWATDRESSGDFNIKLVFSKKDKVEIKENFITSTIDAVITTITGNDDNSKNAYIKILLIVGAVIIIGIGMYYIVKKIYQKNNSL